jgi:uncharacterized protein (DUF58 family)
MSGRRLFLTTRGALALALVPVSALAGALLGAEELVLVSVALLSLILCGLLQSAHRAAVARGRWRVTVGLASSDAEVGSAVRMTITLGAAGHGRGPTTLVEPCRP